MESPVNVRVIPPKHATLIELQVAIDQCLWNTEFTHHVRVVGEQVVEFRHATPVTRSGGDEQLAVRLEGAGKDGGEEHDTDQDLLVATKGADFRQ